MTVGNGINPKTVGIFFKFSVVTLLRQSLERDIPGIYFVCVQTALSRKSFKKINVWVG